MAGKSRKVDRQVVADGALYEKSEITDRPKTSGRIRQTEPKSRKKLTILIAIIILLGVAIGALYIVDSYQKSKFAESIPESVKNQVDFPLYYPAKLPEGYTAEPVTSTGDPIVVTLVVKSPDGKIIYITQQKKPDNFDFDFFYDKTLLVSRELNLDIGKIRIGSAKGRSDQLTASVVAEPTWILLGFPASIPQEDIDTILNSLKKI